MKNKKTESLGEKIKKIILAYDCWQNWEVEEKKREKILNNPFFRWRKYEQKRSGYIRAHDNTFGAERDFEKLCRELNNP